MDKSRLGRILAAIGVIIALALAGWRWWPTAQAPAHATSPTPAVAAVDRSIIAEMELLARIKELEQIQARLQEQAETLVARAQAHGFAPVQALDQAWVGVRGSASLPPYLVRSMSTVLENRS